MSIIRHDYPNFTRKRRHVIGTTGDVNLFDYDAGVIYSDEFGVHWDKWEQIEEWDPSRPGQVLLHEIDVPANVWDQHSEFKDPKELKSIASTVGMDVDELRDLGMSADVRHRVEALDVIAATWGAGYFDPSPLTLTRAELKRRWKSIKG